MKVIKFDVIPIVEFSEEQILKKIERIGRVCYKSEDKITEDSAPKFVAGLIKRKHFAMLEHASLSVLVTTDRGVSHEAVRHRIASFAQESTRYCNYGGSDILFIDPSEHFVNPKSIEVWMDAMQYAENKYNELIELGETPQMARTVLPNSLKTEIVITMDLREWYHFCSLRYFGTTGAPHPQMKEVAQMAYSLFCDHYPRLFKWLKEEIQK